MLLAIVVCLSAVEMFPQSPTLMSDPLFGITYDPQKIRFEKIPPLLTERCPGLRGRYVAAWVYGHFKTTDSEYFLVSGLMEFKEDSPRGARTVAPEEGGGLIAALRGSACLLRRPSKRHLPTLGGSFGSTSMLLVNSKRYSLSFWSSFESSTMAVPRID